MIENVRGWVIDVDGCLVRTDHAGGADGVAIPGAAELLELVHERGDRVIVCTNASERTPAEYAAHLRDLGLLVPDEEFVTAGSAAADFVAHQHPGARVLSVAGPGVTEPLRALGLDLADPGDDTLADVVVVGAAAQYSKQLLNAAALAVDAGAPLYTTVDVPWFHGGRGRSLAVSSAIAMAVSWATGVTPEVVGKPSAALAETLQRRLGTSPEHTAVVGDSTIEVELAHRMGGVAVLVLSGATAEADVPGLPPSRSPHLTLADVGDLYRALTTGGNDD